MMRFLLIVVLFVVATAFMPGQISRVSRTELAMKTNDLQKAFAASMIGASLFLGGVAANAEINYDGVKYLGGGDKVDINNANIRVYLKFPGLYPTIAGKVVKNSPYKSVADIYNVPTLTSTEKEVLKKYEGKFVALDPKPEYILDKFNNGLYK